MSISQVSLSATFPFFGEVSLQLTLICFLVLYFCLFELRSLRISIKAALEFYYFNFQKYFTGPEHIARLI